MKSHETTTKPSGPSGSGGVLQRKCGCGQHTGGGAQCSACAAKDSDGLQRAAAGPARGQAPPIVHEALHSVGQPLDADTRNFMESRFSHDFSNVRVHTDSRAAQSATAVNAMAYTVGQDIVFGSGQYSPKTMTGRRVLAHELTHTLQQRGATAGSTSGLAITDPGSSAEKEASHAENSIERGHPVNAGVQRAPEIARTPPPASPCPNGFKTFDVYGVNLPGSTRSIFDDLAKANSVLAQCCAKINVVGGESWVTNLLDIQAPTSTLNEFTTMASPTLEETTMLSHLPGGAAIHAYYVPAMSAGSRGENFRPTVNPAVPRAVVVSDSAAVDTFVHELGHILLNVSAHSGDPDNLMADGTSRNVGVDKLDATQCASL